MLSKVLEKGNEELKISGRMKTVQTKAFLISAANTSKIPGDQRRLTVNQTFKKSTKLL